MPDTQNNKVSPIVAIAATSVIVFSAVGVGVMTGVIPSSISKTAEQPPVTAVAPQATAPQAAAPAPAEKPKTAAVKKPQPATEPTRVASAEQQPTRTAQVLCTNCGSVTSVNLVKHKGEGSGLGAVGGAVVGGVLGHQVGSGRGNTAATVVGAGAGAYAGHQIEKEVKSSQSYVVAVRMDDGSNRSFNYQSQPSFQSGDKVRIVEGKLVRD